MNNFVMIRTRRDLSGKDISKEWNFLMKDHKEREIKQHVVYEKSKQNFISAIIGSALYATIVILSRR